MSINVVFGSLDINITNTNRKYIIFKTTSERILLLFQKNTTSFHAKRSIKSVTNKLLYNEIKIE